MVKVDVARRPHHVFVGLVLLHHRRSDVNEPLKGGLHVGFIGKRLGDDHDETALHQGRRPQVVVVQALP